MILHFQTLSSLPPLSPHQRPEHGSIRGTSRGTDLQDGRLKTVRYRHLVAERDGTAGPLRDRPGQRDQLRSEVAAQAPAQRGGSHVQGQQPEAGRQQCGGDQDA